MLVLILVNATLIFIVHIRMEKSLLFLSELIPIPSSFVIPKLLAINGKPELLLKSKPIGLMNLRDS